MMTIPKIRHLFLFAGIGGVLAIFPIVLMSDLPGILFTQAMQNQQNFRKMNMVGALLVQFLIIWISFNPTARRKWIPVAVIEKALAVIAIPALVLAGCKVELWIWGVIIVDGVLGILFYKAYQQLGHSA
jgi:hypothetical protein